MSRVPNLVELGRRPAPVRYIWIAVTEENDIRSGATWMMLRRTLEEYEVKSLRVVDLVTNKVTPINDADALLEQWRNNYFDFDWRLKSC